MARNAARVVLLPALLTGCADGATAADSGEECGASRDGWGGGRAFVEATSGWGLDELGVVGRRVSVVDLDGDPWPDLIVRSDPAADAPPSRLLRNVGGRRFDDVSLRGGLFSDRSGSPAGGEWVVASADVDNDGDADVYVGRSRDESGGGPTSELMLNDGAGVFAPSDVESSLGEEGRATAPRGAVFLDADRDGVVDLFVGHRAEELTQEVLQDRLFVGTGDGTFLEATEAFGLQTAAWGRVDVLDEALGHSLAWGVAACDLNDDGSQDILVSSYGRVPNHLWLARSDGAGFVNHSVESGYAFDELMDWTDNVNAQCHCRDHPDDDECGSAPPPPSGEACDAIRAAFGGTYRWDHAHDRSPWRLGGNSATTTCADIDNDGHIDLLTGEIVHTDVGASSDPAELLFNDGSVAPRFDRRGNAETGLERVRLDHGDMNNVVFDFDNDGWLDVYVSSSDYADNRGTLYRQTEPRLFEVVPLDVGIDHIQSAGVVAVDLDRDGDLDVVAGHSRARCERADVECHETEQVRVFENVTGNESSWIELRLSGGPGTNAMAIGARVEVETCGLTQVREVEGGRGLQGSQGDRVLHFGLGGARVATVRVRWPDVSLTEQRMRLDAGAVYDVTQGAEPTPVDIDRPAP